MAKAKNSFPRAAGILLPITSLASPYGIGTLGKKAYEFVDFLRSAGQRYWQVLPVGPTSYGDSPYQSFSAFAGNPYLIDLEVLCEEGLLDKAYLDSLDWHSGRYVDYARIYELRFAVLRQAFERSGCGQDAAFADFCRDNAVWIDDYALFMSLKNHFDNVEWLKWDEDIRMREPQALERYSALLSGDIAFWKFVQYKFYQQWGRLKEYANAAGIEYIGDIPIYVAMDSADAWGCPEQFQMDERRRPTKVAGVPPDYFSATGQLWGNPLYRWDYMKADSYGWWRRRMTFAARLYDVIRIDHFIGIVRYYAIDADAENAIGGEWNKGPGMELIAAINESIGKTKMIAEDLGEVVPEVRRVQIASGYPGMKVLQFAFDDTPDNHFLPHNHPQNCIVYTGTHDNNTTRGLVESRSVRKWRFARDYLGAKRTSDIPAAMIRAALSSPGHTAIVPIQDWLGIGAEGRINTPSTLGNNWHWRLIEGEVTDILASRIKELTYTYGRISK